MAEERPCGTCGKGRKLTPEERLTELAPLPERNGVIPLGKWPDCWTPYNGRLRMETIYVVGRGTENEALFLNADRKAAIAHRDAFEPKLKINRVSATELCWSAIASLTGEE